MLGKLRPWLEPKGGCGLGWLTFLRRAALLGRGPGDLHPGTDVAGGGQPVSVRGCGAGKLRSRARQGAVRARGLHCCFCINMAVSGVLGGPGMARGGRAGRPQLLACTLGAAVNMAGAVLGPGKGRIGGRREQRSSRTGSGLGPAPAAPGLVAWRAGAASRVLARPSVMAAWAPLLSRGVRPALAGGGRSSVPAAPRPWAPREGRGGVGAGERVAAATARPGPLCSPLLTALAARGSAILASGA